ncbi:hypothetical protein J2T18_002469 [Paenibacillus polymyxa]|nr:hypothetical protein [Paenibacillus polymyxa]
MAKKGQTIPTVLLRCEDGGSPVGKRKTYE